MLATLRQSQVQGMHGVHGSLVLEENGQERGVGRTFGELGSGREIVLHHY